MTTLSSSSMTVNNPGCDMTRKRCYICKRNDPLAGWYDDLTDLEIYGYRLAGYMVTECA